MVVFQIIGIMTSIILIILGAVLLVYEVSVKYDEYKIRKRLNKNDKLRTTCKELKKQRELIDQMLAKMEN